MLNTAAPILEYARANFLLPCQQKSEEPLEVGYRLEENLEAWTALSASDPGAEFLVWSFPPLASGGLLQL